MKFETLDIEVVKFDSIEFMMQSIDKHQAAVDAISALGCEGFGGTISANGGFSCNTFGGINKSSAGNNHTLTSNVGGYTFTFNQSGNSHNWTCSNYN